MSAKKMILGINQFCSMILQENREPSLHNIPEIRLVSAGLRWCLLIVYDVIECGNLSAVVSAARGRHLHTTRWPFYAPASPLIKFELRHLLLLGYPHIYSVGPAQQQRLFALHIQVQRGMLYLLHAPCCRTGLHAMPPCLHYNIYIIPERVCCVCAIYTSGEEITQVWCNLLI